MNDGRAFGTTDVASQRDKSERCPVLNRNSEAKRSSMNNELFAFDETRN